MKTAAIYTRVSSERQKQQRTIGSQVDALIEYAQANAYGVPDEWVFEDEGYSGAVLVRPGLERVRDLAAEGQIEAVLVPIRCCWSKSLRVRAWRWCSSRAPKQAHPRGNCWCTFKA